MSKFVSEIMQRLSGQDLIYLKKQLGNNELNVISFTDSVLHLLFLTPQQKLNFTKGIVQLFRKISVLKQSTKITFSDCHDYFISKNSNVQAGIYQKQLPLYIKQQTRRYAQPPVVYGKKDTENVRIREYLECKDAQGNAKKPVKDIQVAGNNRLVFCLYERSDQVFVYDGNYNRKRVLRPENQGELVVSFRWSENQATVAAILDRSITFWSEKDQFKYPMRFECQDFVMHLHYLESCNLWATVRRKDGAIMYWDITSPKCLEVFEHEFLREDLAKSHSILYMEIKFASLFCVAAGMRMHFISFNKKQLTLTIDIFKTKIRSIDYSDEYQLMFVACFDTKVNVFELNPVYCDFLKKQSKIQSKNILICVTHRPKTSTLVTFDQKYFIKLWNIVDMSCYQTVLIGSSVPVCCMLCLTDRLLVGGLRISFYMFDTEIVEERKAIQSMAAFDQMLFLAVNRQIRCVNLKTGKTDRVLESVTEEDVAKIYFNQRRESLAVLTVSGIIREVSLLGDEIQKSTLPKDIISVNVNKQSNTLYISANKQVLSYFAEHSQQFKVVSTINKIQCQFIAYNYFLDLIALLSGSTIYVIQQKTYIITHQIQVNTEDLLDMQFISGLEYLILIYRSDVTIFSLGTLGTVGKKYKVPLNLQEQVINCFRLDDEIDDKEGMVRSLDLYVGTNKGKLIKHHIRNVNFHIPKTKMDLDNTNSPTKRDRKGVVTSLELMKFNFTYDKANIADLQFSYLINEITTKQTKLKNIRFLEVKPDTTVPSLVIIGNINMVLVYNSKCELVGEINISFPYPIQWQAEDYSSINVKHEKFAKKILNYLGQPDIEEISPKKRLKDFVVREEVEDLKVTHQNTFKKRRPFGQSATKKTFLEQSQRLQTERKRFGDTSRKHRTVSVTQAVRTSENLKTQPSISIEDFRVPSRLATEPIQSIAFSSPIRSRTLDRSGISTGMVTKAVRVTDKEVKKAKAKKQDLFLMELNPPKELTFITLPNLSRKVSSSADKLRKY